MNIDEYEFAKQYIVEGISNFRKLRRVVDFTNRNYEMATNISPNINRNSKVINNSRTDIIENRIIDMIDSKQLYQETFHECVAYCKPLYDLPDETGSEILFYYYFLKFSMTDISKLLLVCKNTCYRHLNIAVSQLDSYLKESGNYKINYKYIK